MSATSSQLLVNHGVKELDLERAQPGDDWRHTVVGEDKFKRFQMERMRAAFIADREDSAIQLFSARNLSGEKFIR
jgi:hypothetical protein